MKYDPANIEPKWQAFWETNKTFETPKSGGRKPPALCDFECFKCLIRFPKCLPLGFNFCGIVFHGIILPQVNRAAIVRDLYLTVWYYSAMLMSIYIDRYTADQGFFGRFVFVLFGDDTMSPERYVPGSKHSLPSHELRSGEVSIPLPPLATLDKTLPLCFF